MSNPSLNDSHSPLQIPPPIPCPPDFAALAKTLQDTAEALLAFGQSTRSAENKTIDESESVDANEDENDTAKKTSFLTRTYRLPTFILEEEQKILTVYKARDWKEVLGKVYKQLYITTMLMQLVPPDEEFDGFSVQLIAENLMMPLNILNTLCSIVGDFRLIKDIEAE